MKLKILTLGCKVNTYESEYLTEIFLKNGYKITNDKADVIIINTCTVTNQADQKSRKLIRRERRNNPNSIIIVCGCMAQNKQENLDNLNIDILLGNKDKSKIIDYLNQFLLKKEKITKFYDLKQIPFEDMTLDKYQNKTRAFVKIEDGCNNYCTYCIIPYIRGFERSKEFSKVLNEVKTLVNNGHQEIVLTGIHTGSYHSGGKDLTDLIHEISLIEKLQRIRISSIEITELNDKFLNELLNNSKICNHLHIPLQSGSDKILKLMNRRYDVSKYLDIINKIKKIKPDINITTDVIVGFPSETDEDFNDTYKLCQQIGFSKIHVFPYSKRNGTVAAKMTNHVDGKVKKERSHKLINLSNELEYNYAKRFLNQEMEVLVEEKNKGRTSNYLEVILNNVQVNKMTKIQIIRIIDNKIYGKVLK